MKRDEARFTSHVPFQKKTMFEGVAIDRIYEKCWYEFQALQFMDWIADRDMRRHANLALLLNVGFAGQLGRLVEQYYWRFRFEEAAITGAAARKGASAGGRAKAKTHKLLHSKWQTEALKIWSRHPGWSKLAVAKQVRKNLGIPQIARHITKYINRP